MLSDEKKLDPINDTLNSEPPRFGMPWYVVLSVVTISALIFVMPFVSCKIFGAFLTPSALGFGWWLCRHDPKEPLLLLHDMMLPSEFDPGK